jgi:hypothetical protein
MRDCGLLVSRKDWCGHGTTMRLSTDRPSGGGRRRVAECKHSNHVCGPHHFTSEHWNPPPVFTNEVEDT